FKLLAGGVALGLCLLSGGPLAAAVFLVLLVHILAHPIPATASQPGPLRRAVVPAKAPALRSLFALGLTGFAVGGWWVMMMSSRYGLEFWSGWLTGLPHRAGDFGNGFPIEAVTSAARRSPLLFGGLFGLFLFGAWRALLEVWA